MIFADGVKNDNNQLFRFEEVDHHTYVLKTVYGYVLDVENDSKENGARVIQWDHDNSKNQLWRMQDPKDITSSSSDWEGGF